MEVENFNPYYDVTPPQQKKGNGFAIASLVFGILSIIGWCFCLVHIVTIPLAIIFGIVALVKKQNSIMSGIGLALGLIHLLFWGYVVSANFVWVKNYKTEYHDMELLIEDYKDSEDPFRDIVIEYQETAELPEYLEKYSQGEYEEWFEDRGLTFNTFMKYAYEYYTSEEAHSEE